MRKWDFDEGWGKATDQLAELRAGRERDAVCAAMICYVAA